MKDRIPSFSFPSQIIRGEVIDDTIINSWLSTSSENSNFMVAQEQLITDILLKNTSSALHLLSFVSNEFSFKKRFEFPHFMNWDVAIEIVKKEIQILDKNDKSHTIPQVLEKMCIAFYHHHLSAIEKVQALEYLKSKISPIWGWIFFGESSNMTGDTKYDNYLSQVFCELKMTKSMEEIFSIQDEVLRNAVLEMYLGLLDSDMVNVKCPYSRLRKDTVNYYSSGLDAQIVLFSLHGLKLRSENIKKIELLQIYLSLRDDHFELSPQLFKQLYQLQSEDIEFWKQWIIRSNSLNKSAWRLFVQYSTPTNQLIKDLDDFEISSMLQFEAKDIWKVFLSGVILPKHLLDKINDTSIAVFDSEVELCRGVWLSHLSEHTTYKIIVLKSALNFLQCENKALYEKLRNKYVQSTTGWLSSMASKIGRLSDSVNRVFVTEIPSELDVEEVLIQCISGIDGKECSLLFQS